VHLAYADMRKDGIYIRLAEGAFTYSILCGGRLIETGTVETAEEVAPGYYGGSEVMD
jgi:hypothetical protein